MVCTEIQEFQRSFDSINPVKTHGYLYSLIKDIQMRAINQHPLLEHNQQNPSYNNFLQINQSRDTQVLDQLSQQLSADSQYGIYQITSTNCTSEMSEQGREHAQGFKDAIGGLQRRMEKLQDYVKQAITTIDLRLTSQIEQIRRMLNRLENHKNTNNRPQELIHQARIKHPRKIKKNQGKVMAQISNDNLLPFFLHHSRLGLIRRSQNRLLNHEKNLIPTINKISKEPEFSAIPILNTYLYMETTMIIQDYEEDLVFRLLKIKYLRPHQQRIQYQQLTDEFGNRAVEYYHEKIQYIQKSEEQFRNSRFSIQLIQRWVDEIEEGTQSKILLNELDKIEFRRRIFVGLTDFFEELIEVQKIAEIFFMAKQLMYGKQGVALKEKLKITGKQIDLAMNINDSTS